MLIRCFHKPDCRQTPLDTAETFGALRCRKKGLGTNLAPGWGRDARNVETQQDIRKGNLAGLTAVYPEDHGIRISKEGQYFFCRR
jgi:hypothetical protein